MMGRILPVLILIGAVGLFFGFVQPAYTGEIAERRLTVQGFDNALAAADLYKEREAALKREQEAIPLDDRSRIQAFLPDGVDNVQLIVDLNALASRSGIRLSNFNVETPDEEAEPAAGRIAGQSELDGLVESLDITVRGVGTYSAFRTFLDGVEHSLRMMDLTNLSIADSETGVYSYDMTFRIYWLR